MFHRGWRALQRSNLEQEAEQEAGPLPLVRTHQGFATSCASTLDLPSSVKIVDIIDNDPPTDHEPEGEGRKTTNFAQGAFKDSWPSTPSTDQGLCQPPSVNLTLLTTSGIDHDLFALDDAQSSVQVLLDHTLPLSKHARMWSPSSMFLEDDSCQGITHSTYRFPELVQEIHSIAQTRPKDFAQDPYLSAQASSAKSLPLHKDKNNHSRTWLIAFSDYTSGRLWTESRQKQQ